MSEFHPKHVYAIGIAGVGVSAIARYYLERGVKVSGSDPRSSPLVEDLQKLGADIVHVPNAARLISVDLVVYSDDVPADQPEREAAADQKITSLSFAQALGQIMKSSAERVAVAGTNGKSTTSAMLGLLLAEAGLDPSVFVGSRVPEFHGNLRQGKGPIFVAEADEYRDHFQYLNPTITVVTNIELDHVEFFKNIDQVIRSFSRLIQSMPANGTIIYNEDDPICRRLWENQLGAISVGFSDHATVQIDNYHSLPQAERFELRIDNQSLGNFELHTPGRFNVMNAALALATAHHLGAKVQSLQTTLKRFTGIWRRFEILNPGQEILVVNDYAHHPTGVRVTLEGAREFYPDRRIIAVFQPHHYQRLQALFPDFVTAFDAAHQVILTDVYAVAGREPITDHPVTSQDLAKKLHQRKIPVMYAPNLTDVINVLSSMAKKNDVIILMGAGDIWTIGHDLAIAYGQA